MNPIEIELRNEDDELVGKEDINIDQINSTRNWKDKKRADRKFTLIVMANGKRYIISGTNEEFKESLRKKKQENAKEQLLG